MAHALPGGPKLRDSLLLQRRRYQEALLGAVETGQIQVGELNLDLEQRRRLLWDASPEIKTLAARFWHDEEYGHRKTLVTEWLAKLPAAGDVQRGREVFGKTCAQCHQLANLGHAVGPDLSDAAHRSIEDLLSNILDPNMAINPTYTACAKIAKMEKYKMLRKPGDPSLREQIINYVNAPPGGEIVIQIGFRTVPTGAAASAVHDINRYFLSATLAGFRTSTSLASERSGVVSIVAYLPPGPDRSFPAFVFPRFNASGEPNFTSETKQITFRSELTPTVSGQKKRYDIFIRMNPMQMLYKE